MVRISTLLIIVSLLQGCSGSAVKKAQPSVTSNPSGAAVYVNGGKVGVTPLHANLYKLFPASWSGWTYQAAGVLSVKKPGCGDFNLKVSDAILAKPIHAKLTCDKNYVAPERMPAHMPDKPIIKKKKMSKIEKRLGELKGLYQKGVITQEEYKATRKRILKEL